MDFRMTHDMDFDVKDGVIQLQEDEETTLITAIFSDARVSGRRGHWDDIETTDMWKYDQARQTEDTAMDIADSVRQTIRRIQADKLYERIEVDCYILDGIMTLDIKAYDKKQLVVDRRFAI